MKRVETWRAALRWLWGTNAEMDHPKVQAEAERMVEPVKPTPKSVTEAKIQRASAAIDHAKEATDRLIRLQPAKSLDEALRQLTGRA